MIDESHQLARLLSGRPGLSRPEKEEILEAVLDRVQPEAPESSWSHGWLGVVLAMASAALALVLIPRSIPPLDNDEFTARGTNRGPQLSAICAATSVPGRCAQGGELLFELADGAAWSHIAMFAFRSDGAVIWYAPDEPAGVSLTLEHEGRIVLLPKKITLGSEHVPGRYDVVAVLSTRPLDRAAIRRIYEAPRAHPEARVVEVPVWVR